MGVSYLYIHANCTQDNMISRTYHRFVNEFHCLKLRDLQTLNDGHAGCGRPIN